MHPALEIIPETVWIPVTLPFCAICMACAYRPPFRNAIGTTCLITSPASHQHQIITEEECPRSRLVYHYGSNKQTIVRLKFKLWRWAQHVTSLTMKDILDLGFAQTDHHTVVYFKSRLPGRAATGRNQILASRSIHLSIKLTQLVLSGSSHPS